MFPKTVNDSGRAEEATDGSGENRTFFESGVDTGKAVGSNGTGEAEMTGGADGTELTGGADRADGAGGAGSGYVPPKTCRGSRSCGRRPRPTDGTGVENVRACSPGDNVGWSATASTRWIVTPRPSGSRDPAVMTADLMKSCCWRYLSIPPDQDSRWNRSSPASSGSVLTSSLGPTKLITIFTIGDDCTESIVCGLSGSEFVMLER